MSSEHPIDNDNAAPNLHIAGTEFRLDAHPIDHCHLCIVIRNCTGRAVLRILLDDFLTLDPTRSIGDIRLIPEPFV